MSAMRQFCCIFCAVMAMMLFSCSDKVSSEEVVANTAQLYYSYLLEGKYEDFVAGIDHRLKGGADYDAQLVANAKMFVHQQKERHEGIRQISIANAVVDAEAHAANVFLLINFADSTSEQIVVPMVERDGIWYMR